MAPHSPASWAPRVGVLLTTYNGARLIAETIDSVLAQTFEDFELVVVDDASQDGTAGIVAAYSDPRIRLIRNSDNLGVVGARNRGFAELRNAYVATIDHDDMWLPTRLAEGVARLDADPATALVATRTLVQVNGCRMSAERPAPTSPWLFRWMLLMDCPVVYSSLLFRRQAAERADGTFLRPDLRYADDYELMLRLASLSDATVLDQALTVYRVHEGNTTPQVQDEMFRHAVAVLSEHLAPWLRADAAEAARLFAWHIARRMPVRDGVTLGRLEVLLRRLANAFVESCAAPPADQARIMRHARDAWWRVLRVSIRSGRVRLLGRALAALALASPLAGSAADLVEPAAVGLLRLAAGRRGREPAMPAGEE